jgi:hypothetical protein
MLKRVTREHNFFVRLSTDNMRWIEMLMKKNGYTSERCRTEFINNFFDSLRVPQKGKKNVE